MTTWKHKEKRLHEGGVGPKIRSPAGLSSKKITGGYEEQMTDVNITVQLLADAFDDPFDTALVISADSDLTTPVSKVRQRFPVKRVVIPEPPGHHSTALCNNASGYFTIGEAKLRSSQLPDQVQRADGFVDLCFRGRCTSDG